MATVMDVYNVGGAECVEDIRVMLESAGFKDIKLEPKANSREIIKKIDTQQAY